MSNTTARGEFAHPEYLVETDWLAHHLSDADVRVLDATTHLVPPPDNFLYQVVSGRADFEKAHIPGAAFVDIDAQLSDHDYPPQLHFMLPSAAQFGAVMGNLGVDNATFVVCYSSANHWWATRLWWMLRAFGHDRAAVLNGGMQKWLREGRPVETGPAGARAQKQFIAKRREGYVVGKEEVRAAIGAQETCTINALRPEQHAGTGGTRYGRPGHISGSINVPAVHLVDENNIFKPVATLRAMLSDALTKPRVITYCGGGIAATSVTLALTMLGHENVQVYDASMSEWAADAGLPMETGS